MKFRIKKHKCVYNEGYYYTVQKNWFLFWYTPLNFTDWWNDTPKRFSSIEDAKLKISEYVEEQKNCSIKTKVVEELYYPYL